MMTDELPKNRLRQLLDDARDFPATMVLGGAWVVVFLLMVANRLLTGPLPSLQEFLVGNIGGAHAFGDMTLNEVFRGEVWRVVTCTFVHYNLLHIGMNLYGFYQLGCLLESWYGSAQFVAIYLVVGGGGNLVSALIRHARDMEPRMHSGGGSTVVLGLVGLCAVVGWRARSRIGDYLRGQMVGILLFTAFLGQVLPIIDNWGHAGGALMGAIVGFLHRGLVRTATRPAARWAGGLAALVLILCGAAQWRDARIENSYRASMAVEQRRVGEAQRLVMDLVRAGIYYQLAGIRSEFEHSGFVPKSVLTSNRQAAKSARPGASGALFDPLANFQTNQAALRASLVSAEKTLGTPPTQQEYQRVLLRLDRVLKQPPTGFSKNAFNYDLGILIRRASQDLSVAQQRRVALARKAGME